MGQEAVGCHGHWLGHRPHEPHQRTGHGHDHWVGMCPSGHQASVSCAQSHVGVPADVLDGFGWCFQSELEMPADLSGVTVGPGAFHDRATRMRVPAVVIEPCRRRSPREDSEGISPKQFMRCLG
jgi:hypothetical protein